MLASLGLILLTQLILFFKPHFYTNETQHTFNAFLLVGHKYQALHPNKNGTKLKSHNSSYTL